MKVIKPLVCFYQEEQFIYSTNYVLHTCKPEQSINDFLNHLEKTYKDDLRVVQINFEYENQDLFKQQQALYQADKASVFILNQYEILSQKELFTKINNTLTLMNHEFKPLESKEDFTAKVEKIKTEIKLGRIYQVNLTAPLMSETTYTSEKIFKNYFLKFTGAYKALLPLARFDLISFSPELFLRKQSNKLKTQPIKGSLPHSADFEKDLIGNRKEEAELSMIVDLLRNDLNRLATDSQAVVTKHRELMQLGYIQHTFSEIEVETTKNLAEVLAATAPGGSISGCPKVESLKVIAELETYKRQAYTGALGWWKDNNFCLNLSIRTFIKKENQLYYHAGCGIVYDSDANKEWDEFLLKTGQLNVR
jgi:para-aminobenzoate synthetase component I